MRKLFITVFLGVCLSAYSQEFLYNSDYAYGVGQTDSAAVMSLATSIKVSVVSETNYTIKSEKNRISEVYDKKAEMSSSIIITDSKLYISPDGLYYRYINKKEYVDNQVNEYLSYMQKANEIKGTNVKHEPNLLMGLYYLAYNALDTPLMNAFNGVKYEAVKNDIKHKAQQVYYSDEYGYLCIVGKDFKGYSVYMAGKFDPSGSAQPADLIGFEYYFGGRWKSPYRLSTVAYEDIDISNEANDDTRYKMCVVEGNNSEIKYRKIYEIYENGAYVKINVPDNWYFKYKYMDGSITYGYLDNPKFLN